MTQVSVRSPGALHWLADGWHSLRDKALQALTYFKPDNSDSPNDQRWGVMAADLIDHEDHISLELEAPGLDKDDININLEDGYITVTGNKKSSQTRTVGSTVITERAYGVFKRVLRLPCEVDDAKTTARYTNGILTVSIPKANVSKPRKVPVTAR